MEYKKIIPLLFMMIVFCLACGESESKEGSGANSGKSEKSGKDSGIKKYAVETGIIKYKMSGMQTGTETLYFTRYGMTEARYSDFVMEVLGMSMETKKLSLQIDEMIYDLDYKTNQGTKIKNPLYDALVRNKSKSLAEIGLEMLKSMGGVKIGTENVAGKQCEVWEVKSLNTKTWVWKNITLKTVSSMMGMDIVIVAEDIRINVSVPKEKVSIPAGVKFIDVSNVFDQFGK